MQKLSLFIFISIISVSCSKVAKENQQELIITRNTRDFKKSSIPVFTPEDYLKIISNT